MCDDPLFERHGKIMVPTGAGEPAYEIAVTRYAPGKLEGHLAQGKFDVAIQMGTPHSVPERSTRLLRERLAVMARRLGNHRIDAAVNWRPVNTQGKVVYLLETPAATGPHTWSSSRSTLWPGLRPWYRGRVSA